jgi:hypothetical protein
LSGVVADAQTGRKTVADQLSLAITLYASDDDTPQAERLFLDVIHRQPVTVPDGATARYYLGRLYHRNYYMIGQKNGLNAAVDRYKEVHLKGLGAERGGAWYADARFYKSLAYLELGRWKDAFEAIDHIDPRLDAEVEVDYLVWTVKKRMINRRVPTRELRDACLKILQQHNVVKSRPDGADVATKDAVLASLQAFLQAARPPAVRI